MDDQGLVEIEQRSDRQIEDEEKNEVQDQLPGAVDNAPASEKYSLENRLLGVHRVVLARLRYSMFALTLFTMDISHGGYESWAPPPVAPSAASPTLRQLRHSGSVWRPEIPCKLLISEPDLWWHEFCIFLPVQFKPDTGVAKWVHFPDCVTWSPPT
jgi:hypothetical protein